MTVKHNLSNLMEEETLKDVAADINAEVEETTNSNESGDEEATDLAGELEKQRKANAQILARAKKAEDELKKFKTSTTESKPVQNITNDNNQQLSDELKLIARGLSDEEIEQAKIIAKGKGVGLIEAVKDPMFSIIQKDIKEKQKREEAKLGASRGSSESKEAVTGLQSGSSEDEHKKAFEKLMLGK